MIKKNLIYIVIFIIFLSIHIPHTSHKLDIFNIAHAEDISKNNHNSSNHQYNQYNQYNIQYEVLSFAPHLTDILQELNLTPYVKGISDDGVEFKKQKIYQSTPVVSDARSVFQEEILKIKKNINLENNKKILIALLWENGNPKTFAEVLSKRNIPVVYFKTKSIDDIFYTAYYLIYLLHPPQVREFYLNKIRNLQKNTSQQKIIFKEKYHKKIKENKEKNKEENKFFQPIWSKPWMILNGENYSNDFLAHCSLENAFKNAASMQISEEALLKTPFKHIIYHKNSVAGDKSNKSNQSNQSNELFALKRFSAFQNKNWHAVDTNVLIRPNLKHIAQLPSFCEGFIKH